jgi:hypothetical protein
MPAATSVTSWPRVKPRRCFGPPRTPPQTHAGTLGACVRPEPDLPEIARRSRTPHVSDTPIDPDERYPREAPALVLFRDAPRRSETPTIELSAERVSPLQALAFELSAPARARESPRSHPTRCPLTSRQRSTVNLSLRPWSMRPWESAGAAATRHGFARSHGPPEQRVNGPGINFRLTLRCAAAADCDPLFRFLQSTRCKAPSTATTGRPARPHVPCPHGTVARRHPRAGVRHGAGEIAGNQPRTTACRGHHRRGVRDPDRGVGRRCPRAARRHRSARAWRRHSTTARCGRATSPRRWTCG